MKKVICLKCKEQNLKSQVSVFSQLQTSLFVHPFYDEDGFYHVHDPNYIETTYRCSNGHGWKEWERRLCFCGWGKEEEKE